MANYNSTLQTNNTDLQAILNQINELPEAGGKDPVLQDKTVSPTTSQQTITADSGYDGLSKVTVNAMPTATQATPSITVNSSGLITASATQTAGYVTAGTKSATKQLTTQSAKTVTPTKSSQTAVAKDRYTTGAVTVAAIPAQYITTTDATATAADMRSGKTAYVNGAKVTGSIADFDGSYECSGESTGSGSNNAQWIYCNDLPTTYIAVDGGGTGNNITVYLELTDDMDAVSFNIQSSNYTSPSPPLYGRALIGRGGTAARWKIYLTDVDLTTEIVSEDTCYFCKLTFNSDINIYAHIIYV